jgi:hypothetical protein
MIHIPEPGPKMKEFGDCFGIDHEEVLQWVLDYCNGPWPESLIPHLEKTEKERLESIKKYIDWWLENSLSRKIKAEMRAA